MQSFFIDFTLKSMIRRRHSWRRRFFFCTATVTFLFLLTVIYSTSDHAKYIKRQDTYGSWNFSIYQSSTSTLGKLRKNVLIDSIGTMTIYGKIVNDPNDSPNYIGTMDEEAKALTGLTFEQGTYPKEANEIALEKDLLLQLGVNETLGESIDIAYVNAKGEVQGLSFTLCGIVNSYHNTYLKQGPLVTAFVTNDFNSIIKMQESKNLFIKLKGSFSSEKIMEEIQTPIINSSFSQNEKWYYNTYIQDTRGSSSHALLIILSICGILIIGLYHNFFYYYKYRYHKLINSQLMGLNKKKLFKMFRQESILCDCCSLVLGLLIGIILTFTYYGLSKFIEFPIMLYLDYKLLASSITIIILALSIGTIVPAVHAYYLFDKKPKLRFPSVEKTKPQKKYNSTNFILLRYLHVYKSNFLNILVLNTVTATILITFSIIGCHLYTSMTSIYSAPHTDYTIGYSPFKSSNKYIDKSEIPAHMLEKIDNLTDISSYLKYRYTFINDTPLIELPTVAAPGNMDKQNQVPRQQDEDCCIVYIPKDYSFSEDNPLFKEMPSVGDVITFKHKENIIPVKVVKLYDFKELQDLTNNETVDQPCMICPSKTYQKITGSHSSDLYNYISMVYTDEADSPATTNIIDSMLFSHPSINVTHNALNTNNRLLNIIENIFSLVIFAIFTLSISVTIQRNSMSSSLDYLSYQLHLLWYLGLSKHKIRITFLRSYFLLHFSSLLLGGILSFFVLYVCFPLVLMNSFSFHFNVLLTPLSLIVTIVFLLAYYITQFLFSKKEIKKVLNRI